MAFFSPSFRIAMIGLMSLAIAMGIGRFAFTPLLPLMREDALLTIGEGGWLASVHFLGYLIGALSAAWLSVSPRRTLRVSLVVIALSTLGMGLTSNLVLWFGLRFLAGFASALTLVLVSNFYVRHLASIGQAEKQGWVFSGVGAGIAIAGLGTLMVMAGGIGSAASWQIFGGATLLASVSVSMAIGHEIPDAGTSSAETTSRRTPLLWSLILPYGALGVGYIIPATYLPVMAREVISAPFVFGWAWPLFGAAALVSTLLAARLQRRFSSRRIWIASQMIMAAGLVLPVLSPHIVTILIAGIAVGGTFMVMTMMGMKETHRLAPAGDIMRHLAMMTAAFALGQVIGPVLASSVHAVTGSFSMSLVLASVTLVATAASLLVTARKPVATI